MGDEVADELEFAAVSEYYLGEGYEDVVAGNLVVEWDEASTPHPPHKHLQLHPLLPHYLPLLISHSLHHLSPLLPLPKSLLPTLFIPPRFDKNE